MKLHSKHNWSRSRRKAFKVKSRRQNRFDPKKPWLGEGSRSGRRNKYTKEIEGKTKARMLRVTDSR